MPYKYNPCYFIFALLTIATIQCYGNKDTTFFYLSSASVGGPFHTSGEYISKVFNRTFTHTQIINIIGTGTENNIDRLINGETDLAIIQSDALVRAYYSNEKALKNIEILLPLYHTAVQFFVKDKDRSLPFDSLKARINNKYYTRIHIGQNGSGTFNIIKSILTSSNVIFNEDSLDYSTPKQAYQKLLNGEIDMFAMVGPMPLNFHNESDSSISLISFTQKEADVLNDHFKYLSSISIDSSYYSFLKSDKVITLGLWTFLVATNEFIDHVNTTEDKDYLSEYLNFEKHDAPSFLMNTYSKSNFISLVRNDSINAAILKSLSSDLFFRGIPISNSTRNLFNIKTDKSYYFLALAMFLCIIASLAIAIKLGNTITPKTIIRNYGHLLTGGLIFILYVLAIIYLIKHYEKTYYVKYGVRGDLLNYTLKDLVLWLFTLFFASFSSAFPISTEGKIILSLAPFGGSVTIGSTIIYHFIKKRMQKETLDGRGSTDATKHIVICGWNDKTPALVKSLLQAIESENAYNISKKIAIIKDDIKNQILADATLKEIQLDKTLIYISGDAKEDDALKRANVSEAHTVILLAEDSSNHSDDITLLRAMNIHSFGNNEQKSNSSATKFIDNIFVVAELNNPKYQPYLLENGVDDVIVLNQINSNLLIQSSLNHGMAEVVETLLNSNNKGELHTIPVKQIEEYEAKVRGKTFDEIFVHMREKGILPIGIRIVFEENNKEVVDANEITQQLHNLKKTRTLF